MLYISNYLNCEVKINKIYRLKIFSTSYVKKFYSYQFEIFQKPLALCVQFLTFWHKLDAMSAVINAVNLKLMECIM